MINFVLYAFAVFSNLLVILFLVDIKAPHFLRAYSIASMILGIIVVYFFSSPRFTAKLNSLRSWLLSIVLGIALISLFSESPIVEAIAYAAALLFSDYYVGQCGTKWHVRLYRIFLIASILPVSLSNSSMPGWFILFRTFGAIFFVASLNVGGRPLKHLNVSNPIFYIMSTHFIYFGSLALISFALIGSSLRWWYISLQVGQGMVLKLIDFCIRHEARVKPKLVTAVIFLSLMIGIFVAAFFWDLFAFIIYIMTIFGLVIVARRSLIL